MSAAGAVLASAPYEPALTVHFLGSTARTRKSEHVCATGIKRACRHTNGVRDDEQSCGQQVFGQIPHHRERAAPRIRGNRHDTVPALILFTLGSVFLAGVRVTRTVVPYPSGPSTAVTSAVTVSDTQQTRAQSCVDVHDTPPARPRPYAPRVPYCDDTRLDSPLQ